MKIALLGYGKMGKTIERIAAERGHTINLIVNTESDFNLSNIDIAIDFSVPKVAPLHIKKCLNSDIPVVCGTTGWLAQYETMVSLCNQKNGAFLYASNFSIGVNLFFSINEKLAKLIAPHKAYQTHIHEIHHTQKIDSPSGTAITLAEGVINEKKYQKWEEIANDNAHISAFAKANSDTLPITSERLGAVPGTHIVKHQSAIDTITLSHEAHSREGFALGAVIAAEWLVDKKGVFSMRDVLNIS